MKIFVESAGGSPEHDYNWIDEQLKIIEKPHILKSFLGLLQQDSLSILIGRKSQELVLIVTGIPSKRRDYQNRIIRISIAWVVEDNDVNEPKIRNNKAKIRNLASKILLPVTGEIDPKQSINDCVKSGGENGFTVDFESLRYLLEQEKESSSPSKSLDKKLEIKSDDTIKKLADELKERALPEEDIPLVVVTGIQSDADFKKAKVWRGLANFLDTGDRSQKYSAEEPPRRNGDNISRSSQKSHTDTSELVFSNLSREKITVYILAFLLIISFVSNTWFYIQYNETKELRQHQENINKSKQEFDKLTADIEILKNEKSNLDNDIKFKQSNLISLKNQIDTKNSLIESVDKMFKDLNQNLDKDQQIINSIKEKLKQK